jgi:putative Mg2+ transporter-C (MgtC) family protein
MILDPTWQDILLRLLLTVGAGALIGFNREVHGHSAGLRTTILVGLAACVTMAHANLLLSTVGKAPNSFVNIDVLRLPLGILTGVGFIGGGAIFRRENLVTGVTTAATLWAITAIGLCFGSGQLALGGAATALTIITVWLLKWLENRIPRERRALMAVVSSGDSGVPNLTRLLEGTGYRPRFVSVRRQPDGERTTFDIRWRSISYERPHKLLSIVGEHHMIETFEIVGAAGPDA